MAHVPPPGGLPPPDPARLAEAAARLRPRERLVLELATRHGLSNPAIARRLGIAVSTAERTLARALRKLDRALGRL
jgi:RNA polymerase sigma factor (sigma-70 family)